MPSFIYILQYSLFSQFSFKIGSTENPYNRYKSYGGYYPEGIYKFKYLIKLKSVPDTYKKKKTNLSDLEYVEKELLHRVFQQYSTEHDTIQDQKTEWFKYNDTIERIMDKITQQGYQRFMKDHESHVRLKKVLQEIKSK